jgi:hypothetical protein
LNFEDGLVIASIVLLYIFNEINTTRLKENMDRFREEKSFKNVMS